MHEAITVQYPSGNEPVHTVCVSNKKITEPESMLGGGSETVLLQETGAECETGCV